MRELLIIALLISAAVFAVEFREASTKNQYEALGWDWYSGRYPVESGGMSYDEYVTFTAGDFTR